MTDWYAICRDCDYKFPLDCQYEILEYLECPKCRSEDIQVEGKE